ncbi:hypothetical protein P7C70_g9566, partial [Phenoliferia sp. Uapishka_3]
MTTAPYLSALPPGDSDVPSPISTIPREILGYILDQTSTSPGQAFRNTMRSAALVSTTWRDLAMERLWKELIISTLDQALSIAATPRTICYPTTLLEIALEGEYVGLLEPVLGRLTGLKELVTRGTAGGLAPFFLESAQLKST